ncbi:integration host factor subunit alpha [Thermosulfuriphilus ammonigenes]|uniref:Integration host factor subunit alpha n=1 Tax=Thermosulfuriphilus ammonigenes TaxID=1936021 RepID=A0A6G7PXK2_9BACT|nr:HU family DNA-binding protein [Thermosulfuriphilus ammonigenes]MBA2849343.1 integration host factor subunit alpha [Thermosulfuriphilus ammonigenes]QIJ72419.1 integration host factor subunit alpha [Thermosulfuriphilus ammonigenes]
MKKNKTVTKKELAQHLHDNLGFSVRSMSRVVDEVFELIKEALIIGEPVKIVRFGTFEPYERRGRRGVSPRSGEAIEIPDQKTVVFRPSPTLRKNLNAR